MRARPHISRSVGASEVPDLGCRAILALLAHQLLWRFRRGSSRCVQWQARPLLLVTGILEVFLSAQHLTHHLMTA